jgi:peptidyl-prolyl cis-trans isomerase C
MNRLLAALALAAVAVAPLAAQEAPVAPPVADKDKVVAEINGAAITKAEVDRLWNRMSEKLRSQYEKAGNGKQRFLENYVGKRLLLQLAQDAGFDQSPTVQAELEAAKESALFDLYVRDVIASQIVTEADLRKFYDTHPTDFRKPEQARVRMISIGATNRSKEAAQKLAGEIMKEVYAVRAAASIAPQMMVDTFSALAREHSEHRSAATGGDLGWIRRESIEPVLADAAFKLRRGTVSGILETDSGFHLLLVEDRQSATTIEFDEARAGIREFLIGQNAQKVMEAVNRATSELRASGKVTLHPENLE